MTIERSGPSGLSRRAFLAAAGVAGAATAIPPAAWAGDDEVRLRKAESIRFRRRHHGRGRETRLIRLTGDDGSVGAAPGFFAEEDVDRARQVLRAVNLLDHDAVWRRLQASSIGGFGRATLDNACWDLHARRKGVPAYELLGGKKRDKYPCYGDCRWRDGMTLDEYARSVASAFQRRGMLATKLHLPGTYALPEGRGRGIGGRGMPVADLCSVLKKTRVVCGEEVVLAYDPHPQEAAADNRDDARRVLDVLQACRYEWIESPLPSLPAEKWMPQWIELRRGSPLRFQMEEHRPSRERLVEQLIDWAAQGAIDQFTWDCTTDFGGITPCMQLVSWIRKNPGREVKLNLHYSQPAHQHAAAAVEAEHYPWFEAGFFEGRYEDGYTTIPDWAGVFDWDWEEIEKNRG